MINKWWMVIGWLCAEMFWVHPPLGRVDGCQCKDLVGIRKDLLLAISVNQTKVQCLLTETTIGIPVYSSGSIQGSVGWLEPDGWTGPDPVLYWSFNTLDGLTLMEETQQADYDALTDGKVNRYL